MNTVKIEVNGFDITALAEKIDNLTNVLSGQSRPEPQAANDDMSCPKIALHKKV